MKYNEIDEEICIFIPLLKVYKYLRVIGLCCFVIRTL